MCKKVSKTIKLKEKLHYCFVLQVKSCKDCGGWKKSYYSGWMPQTLFLGKDISHLQWNISGKLQKIINDHKKSNEKVFLCLNIFFQFESVSCGMEIKRKLFIGMIIESLGSFFNKIFHSFYNFFLNFPWKISNKKEQKFLVKDSAICFYEIVNAFLLVINASTILVTVIEFVFVVWLLNITFGASFLWNKNAQKFSWRFKKLI